MRWSSSLSDDPIGRNTFRFVIGAGNSVSFVPKKPDEVIAFCVSHGCVGTTRTCVGAVYAAYTRENP